MSRMEERKPDNESENESGIKDMSIGLSCIIDGGMQ